MIKIWHSVLVGMILIFPKANVSGLTKSTEKLFKSLQTLHSCSQDVLLVSSNQKTVPSTSGSFEFVVELDLSFSLSLLHIDKFLEIDLVSLERWRMPHCILILLPDLPQPDTLILIQKINADLLRLSFRQRKPTVTFLWSQSSRTVSTDLVDIDIDMERRQEEETLREAFRNTSFRLDSNVYSVFVRNCRSDSPSKHSSHCWRSVWEIYSLKKKQYFRDVISIQNNLLDSDFEEDFTENWYEVPSISSRRNDFRREVITASARREQEDWMELGRTGDKLTFKGGFSVNLYWDLLKILNFQERVVIGDGLVTLPNNLIGGKTVEQLNSGDADISLSQSLLVPFRAGQLTFLQPTYYGIIHVFFSQPSASSIRNIVTAPFETTLWFTLIATWLILILSVKISSNLRRRFEAREMLGSQEDHEDWDGTLDLDEKHELDERFSEEIGMWAIAANCQKSWDFCPTSIPMKMVFLTGVVCGVVSYVAYSAAIVSSLAVTIIPVKGFLDLIIFKFKFTVHKRSEPFQIFLQRMIESSHLGQEVIKIGTEEEISHLLRPLKPNAFLTYPDLFYQTALQLNYSEVFICDHISTVRVSDVLYKSGMFLKKGSEYAEIFNHKLIILKERGFNFRYFQKYETKNVLPCAMNKIGVTKVNPVAFSDAFTAFLVIFVGLFFGFFLFLLEVMINKCIVSKKEREDKQKEMFFFPQ